MRIRKKTGFSLIEVVLAVAILGITIVAVIGLLGYTSRAISEVRETTSAARISDLLLAELEREGFDGLTPPVGNQFVFFANPAGDRVVLEQDANNYDSANPYGEPPNTSRPAGIPPRDRFFRIVLTRIDGNNPNQQLRHNQNSGFVAFSVQMEWPWHLPVGPSPTDFVRFDEETPGLNSAPFPPSPQARFAFYHLAVPR